MVLVVRYTRHSIIFKILQFIVAFLLFVVLKVVKKSYSNDSHHCSSKGIGVGTLLRNYMQSYLKAICLRTHLPDWVRCFSSNLGSSFCNPWTIFLYKSFSFFLCTSCNLMASCNSTLITCKPAKSVTIHTSSLIMFTFSLGLSS